LLLFFKKEGLPSTPAPQIGMAGAVADTDPFADAAFVSRLQKLLPMLGSAQAAEADAARRKLLEHLGSHRLSLSDLAQRLPAGRQGGGEKASFVRDARNMGLERQLAMALVARQDAESDSRRAMQRIAELQESLREVSTETMRAVQGHARARLAAAIGWLAAAIVGSLAIVQYKHDAGVADGQAQMASASRLLRPGASAPADPVLHPAAGERVGTVLVQDLAVRLSPDDDAGIRAFLNRGMRVVIEEQVREGSQTWLLIRSVTGSGWVRGGDVLH
jgi:hypothetical protein